MQTFNQNVLNSTEIRNLNNVHYESYQNSNAIINESDMKICDDEEKKNDENDDDDDDDEKLKYISKKEIDSKVWNLQNKMKKKEEKNDENESEKNEIVEENILILKIQHFCLCVMHF